MSATVVTLKFSATTPSSHHLLLRRYASDIILLFNVPPWCSQPHLKSLLAESCGPVKLVKFLSEAESDAWSKSSTPLPLPVASEVIESPYFKEKAEIRFHDALIVFKSAVGAEQLLSRKKEEPLVLQNESRKPVTGIRQMISDYSAEIISDWNHFQTDIDNFMMAYDAKKAAEDERQKERGEEPDDDGWVTVTSKPKKGAMKRGNNNNKEKARNKAKAVAKNKELLNFYKFQKKEKKEDLIQSLREKFEEDKKRVSTMRAERKFKPY